MELTSLLDELAEEAEGYFSKDIKVEEARDIPNPENIYLEKNTWIKVSDVTCVFVDMIGSTALSVRRFPKMTAKTYQVFTGNAVRVFSEFDADYIDVRGDGAFALFVGLASTARAFAGAVTFKTLVEKKLRNIVKAKYPDFDLAAHIGMDLGNLLVKRVGLRGDKQNEVWAGRTVNVASKLAGHGGRDQLLASPRVFDVLTSDYVRKSCGCIWDRGGRRTQGSSTDLWSSLSVDKAQFGFETAHLLTSFWCPVHGEQFCGAILQLSHQV